MVDPMVDTRHDYHHMALATSVGINGLVVGSALNCALQTP